LRLRVYQKTATSSFTAHSLNGLLRQFEDDPPYHIYLRPKYQAVCTINDLINVMKGDSSPLKENLKKNRKFRAAVRKYVKEGWRARPDQIFEKVLETIEKNANDLESLAAVLKSIDFSLCVDGVLKQLEDKGTAPTKLYDNFSFLVYDQISKVEMISYETPFSLCVQDEKGSTKEIPGSYEFSPKLLS